MRQAFHDEHITPNGLEATYWRLRQRALELPRFLDENQREACRRTAVRGGPHQSDKIGRFSSFSPGR